MIKNNLAGMEIIADRQKISGLARCKISLNENDPNKEQNYTDIVYTNTQYYVSLKKFNKKLKKEVPDKYIIGSDLFPKGFIRVKSWEDFIRITEDQNAAGHKAALWLLRNTQIDERMFMLLGDEENLRIPFGINIIEYVKKLADKEHCVPSMELLLDKYLIEINRERARRS